MEVRDEGDSDDEHPEKVERRSEDEIEHTESNKEKTMKKKERKSLMRKEAEKFSEKLAKRGVVYLSRVPPFMKPNKLRNLLDSYGEITRLYLAEEDPSVRKRRKAGGGNGSKQFVEGWIEFANRKVARNVAQTLNNTRIGGKKRDYYHDDMWNMKYLKGFKWDHLTEKFAYERRVRESKLKAAMMQAKRQNAEFVELLDKDEAYQHVKKRSQKRKREGGYDDQQADQMQKKRSFRQLKGSRELNQEQIKSELVNSIFSDSLGDN